MIHFLANLNDQLIKYESVYVVFVQFDNVLCHEMLLVWLSLFETTDNL